MFYFESSHNRLAKNSWPALLLSESKSSIYLAFTAWGMTFEIGNLGFNSFHVVLSSLESVAVAAPESGISANFRLWYCPSPNSFQAVYLSSGELK